MNSSRLGRFFRLSAIGLGLVAPLCFASRAGAVERADFNARASSPPVAAPRLSSIGLPLAAVTAVDEQRGVPTFLWEVAVAGAPRAHALVATPEAAARFHLARHAARYGLSAGALATAEVRRVLDLGRGGIAVVLRQRVDGIEVIESGAKVMLDRGLGLVAIAGNLHPAAIASNKLGTFDIDEREAVAIAFGDLYGVPSAEGDFVPAGARAPYLRFDIAASSALGKRASLNDSVRAKRVYYPLPDTIVPAYYLELDANDAATGEDDGYAYVIAADDGRVLERQNLTHEDTFTYRVWADASGDFRPHDSPLSDFTPHPTGVPDGSYPPFTLPDLVSVEGLNTNPNGAADPWLPPGATVTTGNNVDAYVSTSASLKHFHKGDLRATVTDPGVFDRTYNTAKGPQDNDNQEMAATTQLFYTTNWLHDFWYDSGYDEAAGNAQTDNFGRGGLDNDPMQTQAQAGAPKSRDNSNMVAFSDGKSPIMHMFVWSGRTNTVVSVDGGASLVAEFADYGPSTYDLTAEVVLAEDATAPTTDGCDPITTDLTGKIALVDRGLCDFKQKSLDAQNAGAVGLIIADNVAGEAPFEISVDNTVHGKITIPSVMIGLDDGNTLKGQIAAGTTTVELANSTSVLRDGDLDDTIVAHEWGHSLHLRQVDCDTQICSAESEGWADFDALMMVIRDGDDFDGVYPLGQYALIANSDSQDAGYFGVRRYPYSTDMNVDPLTFKDIQQSAKLPEGPPISDGLVGSPNNEVHNTGEVWAVMLFESYRALLEKTNPAYTYVEAHRKMADYVEASLTMAPAGPTITEQRDALLAAAQASDPADFALIGAAFAKRGAGACAVSPDRNSTTFDGVVESFDAGAGIVLSDLTVDDSVKSCDHDGIVDVGETGQVSLTVTNVGWAPLVDGTGKVVSSSDKIVFPKGATFAVPSLDPHTSTTIKLDVAVDPSAVGQIVPFDLTAEVSSATACAIASPNALAAPPKGVVAVIDFGTFANADVKPSGSDTDDVEIAESNWKTTGKHASEVWAREQTLPTNHVWHGIDLGAVSDTALESPTIDVSKTEPFTLTFKQRYSFEVGSYRPRHGGMKVTVDYDGGVLEVSTDGGATWGDAAQYANPHYDGTIGYAPTMATQALVGRPGYVATNKSWPAFDDVTVNFGLAFAGQKVKLRFRLSSDDSTGADGMELDELAIFGATNQPFRSRAVDAQSCDMNAGGGGSGGGASGRGGSDGNGGSGAGKVILSPGSGCVCNVVADTDRDGSPWQWLGVPALAITMLSRRRRRAVAAR